MGLFENLFACFCEAPKNDNNIEKTDIQNLKQDMSLAHIELKSIITNIEKDVNHVFSQQRDTNKDIKRLEDKIATHFSQLHTRMENMMLLSTKLEYPDSK